MRKVVRPFKDFILVNDLCGIQTWGKMSDWIPMWGEGRRQNIHLISDWGHNLHPRRAGIGFLLHMEF